MMYTMPKNFLSICVNFALATQRYGCVRINVQNCIKNTEKQGKTTKKTENLTQGKICRKSKGKSIFSLTCRTKNTGKMKNAQEIQEEARRNSWEIT